MIDTSPASPTGAPAPVFIVADHRPAAPLRVVLDTNVLLSLWVFADSRFAPFRGQIDAGAWIPLARADTLAEFARVLGYPEFQLDNRRQQDIHAAYTRQVMCIAPSMEPAYELPRCKDRDDQKFLELARDGCADWLISADKAVLKLARRERLAGRFRILTPEAALAEIVNVDPTGAPSGNPQPPR